MITFTAPSSSAYYSIDTDYTVDFNPSNSYNVRRFEVSYNSILSQARPDGINTVSNDFSFNITNMLEAEAIKLLGYFSELAGINTIDITFPEGVIPFLITSWSVSVPKGKFLSISASAEVAYI